MLKRVTKHTLRVPRSRFAIVASQYNAVYVDSMLQAAEAELRKSGATQVLTVRVPGAYEIPVVAAKLARDSGASRMESLDGILCLGVILRGETVHAAHIGEAVSRALMQIQLESLIPVVHEVLLLENEEQARARCLDRNRNRGLEAAQTALKMAKLMRELNQGAFATGNRATLA
jgi:6,7-dimethyl-8-ribityllumazine synthase